MSTAHDEGGRPGRSERARVRAPGTLEAAVDEEILNHIELLTDRLIDGGMEPAAAEREARHRFGSVEPVRDRMLADSRSRVRRLRVREMLGSFGADVRYAARGLIRQPMFALALIGTVALGLGAAASVFSVIDALLLRPLPYNEADRLVELNAVTSGGFTVPSLDANEIPRWRESAEGLDAFAVYTHQTFIRTDGPDPRELNALVVSHEVDDVLGMRPVLGRTFAPDDAIPGTRRAMMGFAYWKASGLGQAAIGSTVELEGQPYDVIGVLPDEFKFPVGGRERDMWVAMGSDLSVAGTRLTRASVLSRLAAGVSMEVAGERAEVVSRALAGADTTSAPWRVTLSAVGGWRGNLDLVRGVKLIAGAVFMMLLIALVNGVNLLLFRATDRDAEMGVRRALGGGRFRILRQVLTEGMIIGLVAALAAVVLSVAGVALLSRLAPSELINSTVYSFRIEQRTALFTMGLAAIAGLVLGTIPGIRAVTAPDGALRGMRSRGASRTTTRLQWSLVIGEVALAVALVSGAGLLGNSLLRLSRVDTGFARDELIALALFLPEARYPTAASRVDFLDRLEREVESRPGIQGLTVANGVPSITGFSFGLELQAEDSEPITSADDFFLMPIVRARPDYMSTIGGRILNGRDLADSDRDTDVVLIDDRLKQALFGPANAVGKQFRTGPNSPWLTVAGVYAHMALLGLDDRESPYSMIRPWSDTRAESYVVAAVRSSNPAAAFSEIRSAVTSIDPQQPVSQMHSAATGLAETIEQPRFLATVMIALAAAALALAAIGIYGVLSHVMTRRRREMGIRLALGAPPGKVRSRIVADGLVVAGVGAIAGVVGAIWVGRLVGSLLYAVDPSDPTTLAATVAIMLAIAALASWVPAVRATRVDPVEVLRAE